MARQSSFGSIPQLTPEEGWKLLEERTQGTLGISAKQFVVQLRQGTLGEIDRPEVMRLVMLLPFVEDGGQEAE